MHASDLGFTPKPVGNKGLNDSCMLVVSFQSPGNIHIRTVYNCIRRTPDVCVHRPPTITRRKLSGCSSGHAVGCGTLAMHVLPVLLSSSSEPRRPRLRLPQANLRHRHIRRIRNSIVVIPIVPSMHVAKTVTSAHATACLCLAFSLQQTQ